MDFARVLPWRMTHLGGVPNTCVAVPIRRALLRCWVAASQDHRPDSVTVVIGIRNRSVEPLVHSLASIRRQDLSPDLVKILIVDYGSNAACAAALESVAADFDAQYVRVTTDRIWSRPRCLNFGIRRVTTKYLLSSDCDIVFPQHYLSTAVNTLRQSPLSVAYSRCWDLTPDGTDALTAGGHDVFTDLPRYGAPRSIGDCNAGINMTLTRYYQWIRGYDEYFEGWGSEDNDLQRRFELLGLTSVSLSPRAAYAHQWHPKGLGVDAFQESASRNDRYFQSARSIIRNDVNWGTT